MRLDSVFGVGGCGLFSVELTVAIERYFNLFGDKGCFQYKQWATVMNVSFIETFFFFFFFFGGGGGEKVGMVWSSSKVVDGVTCAEKRERTVGTCAKARLVSSHARFKVHFSSSLGCQK